MKALIIDCLQDAISAAQFDPFHVHREVLHQWLDLEIDRIATERLSAIGEESLSDSISSVFLLPSLRETPADVQRSVESICKASSDRKIFFIDPFSQVSTAYFNVLPYVDGFLKRQCYRDRRNYEKNYVGGTMVTDFLVNGWHFDLNGWHLGSEVPPGYEDRIISGWNLGASGKFQRLLLNYAPSAWNDCGRDIDVFCRLSLGPRVKQEWYHQYRIAALQAVQAFTHKFKVVAGGGFDETKPVTQFQYFRELKRSRIVFSPFGWGETCWRDFEAACYGCLLVKPSMAHIETQPNIFIEKETYVPVQWDLADLAEQCSYYLGHPAEAAAIVDNARRVYRSYFEQNEFVNFIGRLINNSN